MITFKAVIVDLFHRIKFKERRGSGLTKVLNGTAKLLGYDDRLKPEFFSTPSDSSVVLKNVKYSTMADTAQDDRMNTLIEFFFIPRSRDEMQAYSLKEFYATTQV